MLAAVVLVAGRVDTALWPTSSVVDVAPPAIVVATDLSAFSGELERGAAAPEVVVVDEPRLDVVVVVADDATVVEVAEVEIGAAVVDVDVEGTVVVEVDVDVVVDVEAVVVEAGAVVVNCHVDAEEIPVNTLPAVSLKAPESMST